jgi:hypothetical protein
MCRAGTGTVQGLCQLISMEPVGVRTGLIRISNRTRAPHSVPDRSHMACIGAVRQLRHVAQLVPSIAEQVLAD